MKLLYSSYVKDPVGVCFTGEDSDEKILLVLRKHVITNLRWILGTILLFNAPVIAAAVLRVNGVTSLDFMPLTFRFIGLTLWYIISFGYFFTSFLIWFFSTYIVSDKRVVDIDFHGFIHRSFSEALLSNIEDLTHRVSGATQVIFHFGTVDIQTAGESREIEFEKVPNPAHVQDFISDLTAKFHHHRRENA